MYVDVDPIVENNSLLQVEFVRALKDLINSNVLNARNIFSGEIMTYGSKATLGQNHKFMSKHTLE